MVRVVATPGVVGVVGPGGAVASCGGGPCAVERVAAADRVTLSVGGIGVVLTPGIGGGVEGDGVVRVPVGGRLSVGVTGLAPNNPVRVWVVTGALVGRMLASEMSNASGVASVEITPAQPGVAASSSGDALLFSFVGSDGLAALVQVGVAIGDPSVIQEPAVERVVIVDDSVRTLGVGGSLQLSAVVMGSGGAAGLVTWSSSDAGVATVSSTGLVTGVSIGDATVAATSTVDPTKSATVTVRVLASTTIAISIEGDSLRSVGVGAELQLRAVVTAASGAAGGVAWDSGNAEVATVSSSGLVTGVATGITTITAVSTMDPRRFQSVVVMVVSVPSAPNKLTLAQGDGQLTIAFTIADGGSAITRLEYSLAGGDWIDAGTLVSPVVIGGLTNGTTYAVRVRGANAVGEGPASAAVTGAPSAFYLASNGVTVMCPNATVGAAGVVGAIAYTKRVRAQIDASNAAATCTSGITDMSGLFYGAFTFNQPIGSWDTSSVTNMSGLFLAATAFNQPLGAWDTRNVTTMSDMFYNALVFNQEIDQWDTGNVSDMSEMFSGALKFNQNLSNWCVAKIATPPTLFDAGAEAWTLPRPSWGTCPPREP